MLWPLHVYVETIVGLIEQLVTKFCTDCECCVATDRGQMCELELLPPSGAGVIPSYSHRGVRAARVCRISDAVYGGTDTEQKPESDTSRMGITLT